MITRESRSDITSESDEWNYDIMAQSRSPSSSASGIASQSSSKSRPRRQASKPASRVSSMFKSPGSSSSSKGRSQTSSTSKSASGSAAGSVIRGGVTMNDTRDVDVESDRYSDAASGSVTRSERELARSRQNRETGHEEFFSRGTEESCDVTTTRRQEGDYEAITTDKCSIFPCHRGSSTPHSSPHSSVKFSSPNRRSSKGSSSPKSPRDLRGQRHEQEPHRVLEDVISFTFSTPQNFSEKWESVGECTGIRSDNHGYQDDVHSNQLLVRRLEEMSMNREVNQQTRINSILEALDTMVDVQTLKQSKELRTPIEDEAIRQRVDAAKKRAATQNVDYSCFSALVSCAHLKPMKRKELDSTTEVKNRRHNQSIPAWSFDISGHLQSDQ